MKLECEFVEEILSAASKFQEKTGKFPNRVDIPIYMIDQLYRHEIGKTGFIGSMFGLYDIYVCGDKVLPSARTPRRKYY